VAITTTNEIAQVLAATTKGEGKGGGSCILKTLGIAFVQREFRRSELYTVSGEESGPHYFGLSRKASGVKKAKPSRKRQRERTVAPTTSPSSPDC